MSRLILMGPPGAGKGQQSEILKKAGYQHIAVGDLLRAVVSDDKHPLHHKLVGQMDGGGLVDDDVIMELMSERLSGLSDDRDVLLDGFPRTVAQAKAMIEKSLFPTTIIVLVVDRAVVAKRISGRLIDPPSGRVYNIYFSPPKHVGVDDVSGRSLIQRKDDKPEIVAKRLNIYFNETYPVIRFFQTLSEKSPVKIVYIDGMGAIDEVASAIESSLF